METKVNHKEIEALLQEIQVAGRVIRTKSTPDGMRRAINDAEAAGLIHEHKPFNFRLTPFGNEIVDNGGYLKHLNRKKSLIAKLTAVVKNPIIAGILSITGTVIAAFIIWKMGIN